MKPELGTVDAEQLIRDPSELVQDEQLSIGEKIDILENWRLDLVELQQATEENMAGPAPETGEVAETLRRVGTALLSMRRERTRGRA